LGHWFEDGGIADTVAGSPYFVAFGAFQRAGLRGASGTGVDWWVDMADIAEGREQRVVHDW